MTFLGILSIFQNLTSIDNLKTRFMITYNANPKLIDLYKTYYCLQWDLKYTMRSTGTYRQDQQDRKELLITNYER